MSNQEQHLHTDTWQQLRELTAARIGLGRAGTSLPTIELLKFQLAHAQAADALEKRRLTGSGKQRMTRYIERVIDRRVGCC
mgnify:CR=1 FL=1